MPAKEPLIKYGSLEMYHEPEALPDVEEAVTSTILGNEGGIRYRQLDAARKIREIKPLHFFPLRKGGRLISVLALAERTTSFRDQIFATYNVRYVSFHPGFAIKNADRKNAGGLQKMTNSFLKEAMTKHSETYPFSLVTEGSLPDKRIYYAYVEDSNLRSLNYTEFFFDRIRKFSILPFSDLFPVCDQRVSVLPQSSVAEMTAILKKTYHDHSFFFLDERKPFSDYFILKRDGEIVAGVQAGISNWKIEELPGVTGKIIKAVLPRLPVFRRILKPGRFSFLTLDTLYCKEGCEHLLPVLFRSVCAMKKVYAAMIYFDSNDPLKKKIENSGKLGMLHKMFGQVHGEIMARFVNFTDDEKKQFHVHPVFVSGYDLT